MTQTRLPNSHRTHSKISPIEPIKKVIPITPHRFRIEDQIEQPTFYLFEAKAGQTLNIRGEHGTIITKLFSPAGELLSHLIIHPDGQNQWSGSLLESGLYRVLVGPHLTSTGFIIKINLSDI